MRKNKKIYIIFSLFRSIFLFFDAFVIIQFFAENQQLIFDKNMDDQKTIKKKNTIKKIGTLFKKQQIWSNKENIAKTQNLQNVKIHGLQKTFFSGFLNWILGHLQSSADENKIAIGEISIRAIQKLSDLDQQTIVGGPNFNLTNGKISFIFHYFFVHSIFAKNSSSFFNFDYFSNYFDQNYGFFHFLLIQINNGRTLSFIAIWRV